MKKFKVNINREKISSEEIASRRDFDAVLKSFTAASAPSKPFYKSAGFMIGSAVVVVSAVVTLWYGANYTHWFDSSEHRHAEQVAAEEFNNTTRNPGSSQTSFIDAPFDKLNVRYESYMVNAERGGEFGHSTGSLIKVPAGAFADENGNTVTGEVELRYREFHDPADFFLSGIPMTYDSAGTTYHFESAGMLEIYAFQDGKMLEVKNGKAIEVQMKSEYDGTKYNLYELDTAARNWVYKGKDKVKKKNTGVKDTTSSDSRSMFDQVIADDPAHLNEIAKADKELTAIKKDIAKIEREKPQEPRKADGNRFKFNIEVDPNEFPEIALYKGMVFEVGDENKNFTKEMYKVVWDDAVLSEGSKKGINYKLTLTRGEEKHTFIVYPVLTGKNYDTAVNEYKQKFKEYQSTLEKRRADEKKKEEEYKALVKKLEDERKQQQAQWATQQQQAMQQQMMVANTTSQVFRVFRIDNFGVWNSDSPAMLPAGNMVAASFEDKSGNKLDLYDVFLVDKSRNGVFVYHKNEHDRFRYNPAAKNMLWTVTADNKLAVFSEQDFASVPSKKGAYTFRMEVVDKEFKTTKEIKDFLLKPRQ